MPPVSPFAPTPASPPPVQADGAERLAPATLDPAAAPTVLWLLTEGRRHTALPELVAAFGQHLRDRGVPLDRMTLHVGLLHPRLRGLTHIWYADRPGIETLQREHGIEQNPEFRTSPIYTIIEEKAEGLRVPIARVEDHPFPVIRELKADGITDYTAMPLVFANGRRNVATFATRAPAGFDTAALTLIYDSLPAFTALLEAITLRLLATDLLNIYVGPDAGARILSGDIRRGTGVTISAVLWHCDLQGFTPLSERLSLTELIETLNAYFEVMGGAVEAEGGEILKFIGDAILAIFPIASDAGPAEVADACHKAMRAARTALAGMDTLNGARGAAGLPLLGSGIALHLGDAMYGNIGAPDRLDFTVIGPAVNLVSRLQGLTRRLMQPLLTSAAFVGACPDLPLRSLGFQPVKGVAEPVEVFGLA